MLDQVETMFNDMRPMMKKLKKASYRENMSTFVAENGHYLDEMTNYTDQAEDKEAAAEEIAVCLTDKVYQAFVSPKKKKIEGPVQADLNLFMVYYVFPALLKTEHEDAKLIADKICEQWAVRFKNSNISYTDYDSIYNSFRERVFGLF